VNETTNKSQQQQQRQFSCLYTHDSKEGKKKADGTKKTLKVLEKVNTTQLAAV